MRIDATGHDILAAGINHFSDARCRQILTDGNDLAIITQDIGPELAVGIHYGPATYQYAHQFLL
jgi:hypothetical protein